MAVLDEEVGRLDVPMGDAGIPELADEGKAFVDDLVVDLGVADLLGAIEELRDEQVLRSGVSSTIPTDRAVGSPASPSRRIA